MSTVAKRKAQDLVRKGKIQDAIEKMRELVAEGEADPYDHVYLGDLLMRAGESNDALASYQLAVRSYEAVGLVRNAIAIATKIVRIDSARPDVQRSLAKLYASEGLAGEALPHYLHYLDSFSGEAVPPTEFLEALDQAAALTGARVEVALRLVEHFQRVRRHQRAADLLEEVAVNAAQAGSEEMAAELRQRAEGARQQAAEATGFAEADSEIPQDLAFEISAESESDLAISPGPVNSGEISTSSRALETSTFSPTAEDATEEALDSPLLDIPLPSAAAGDEGNLSRQGRFRLDESTLEAALGNGDPSGPGGPVRGARPDSGRKSPSSGLFEVEHFPAGDGSSEDAGAADQAEDAGDLGFDFGQVDPPRGPRSAETSNRQSPAASDGAPDRVWEIDDPTEAASASVAPARDSEAAAEHAYASGKWGDARGLFESLLHQRPGERQILARLVDVIRHLGDHAGEIHYLALLGDVWIAESEYEEALGCFMRILQLDPGNGAAQRRLAKFRELGIKGAEAIRESDSNALPGILAAGHAEVAVKSGESFRTEDWVELEGLLEEFKSGLKNQMDESDYQAHYDLALSHHSMGLVDEALEEVDVALACEDIPSDVEQRARELRGSCLMELQRFREAVHEYREAAERADGDRPARRAALYNLGRALEAVEEWQEASETYIRLKMDAPGLLDVEKRLRRCESRTSQSPPPSTGVRDSDPQRSTNPHDEDEAAA